MSNPLPTPPPVAAPIAYRPISAFAVAGLVASGLCAGLVLIASVVALYQGAPFFYPLWLVLLPALVGFSVSLIARNRIRGSEGTLAGERLTVAGLWLSLLFGLGYGVYVYVSGLAVTSQANAFFTELGPDTGFLAHLAKASQSKTDLFAAFLLTLPPTGRGSVRPEDEAGMLRAFDKSRDGQPGALSNFKKNVLVTLLASAPPDQVQFEPLGVQSWEYEDRSYKVARLYRIATPEAVLELSLPAASTEGETPGEPRRWYCPLSRVGRPSPKQVRLTPFGEGIHIVRISGAKFLVEWLAGLNAGQSLAFATLDATPWQRLPLTDEQRGFVQARLQDLFGATQPRRLESLNFMFQDESGLGNWRITDDRKVQISHHFRLPLIAPGSGEPLYMVEADAIVETRDPIEHVDRLSGATELPCVLRSIAVTQVAPMAKKKAG